MSDQELEGPSTVENEEGGFLLALGTYDGGILTYKVDAESVEEYYGGTLHKGAVRFVAWADEKTLITGGVDESARSCDCDTGDITTLFVGERGCINAFPSSFGTTTKKSTHTSLTTIASDGTVNVFHKDAAEPVYKTSFLQRDKTTGKPREGDLVRALQNPDIEGLYAVLYLDGSVWLWNVEKRRPLGVLHTVDARDPLRRAISICWSDDGRYVLILTKRMLIAVSISNGSTTSISADPETFNTCISCVDDIVATGNNKGKVKLLRLIRDAESSEDDDDDGSPAKKRRVEGKSESLQIEPWMDLEVPCTDSPKRIKLVRAFVLRNSDSQNPTYGIVACSGEGELSLFELNEDEEEDVEHSELLQCPYVITAIDVISTTQDTIRSD